MKLFCFLSRSSLFLLRSEFPLIQERKLKQTKKARESRFGRWVLETERVKTRGVLIYLRKKVTKRKLEKREKKKLVHISKREGNVVRKESKCANELIDQTKEG